MDNTMVIEPLQGLVQGFVQGHQIHQMILNSSLQQEAEQRRAMQQDRENKLEDMTIQQKILTDARPVDSYGNVTEDTTLGKINKLNGEDSDATQRAATLPFQGDTFSYSRKAVPSRVFTAPNGQKAEWRTPEEQRAAQDNILSGKADRDAAAAGKKKAAEGAAEEPYKKSARDAQAAIDKANNDRALLVSQQTQAGANARNDNTQTNENNRADLGRKNTLQIAADRNTATLQAAKLRGTGAGGGATDDPKVIAQGIMEGKQSPETTGLYGKTAAVRAELQRKGYDLATAQTDWRATQKHMATLNGAQQERLRQAVSFTSDSLDNIDQLYDEWKKVAGVSGLKVLNRANLAASKQLPGKSGEVATNLEAQINDLVSELGTVYKGGNGSTDESLKLASKNLSADWNELTFKRATSQIRKNLQIRRNSINQSAPAGVSANSPYTPKAEQAAPAASGAGSGAVVKWGRDAQGNPVPVQP